MGKFKLYYEKYVEAVNIQSTAVYFRKDCHCEYHIGACPERMRRKAISVFRIMRLPRPEPYGSGLAMYRMVTWLAMTEFTEYLKEVFYRITGFVVMEE